MSRMRGQRKRQCIPLSDSNLRKPGQLQVGGSTGTLHGRVLADHCCFGADSRIDSIVEKCTRKNLRGWIKKGLVGMSGEVWGVADREDREAAFNSMLKYLTNQEGCTVQHLGRKPEGDVQLEPLFFVKSGKKPS